MKKWNYLLVPILVLGLAVSFTGCSKDEDKTTTPSEQTIEEQLVGEWLSAGSNVAPLLVALFSYDSVLVTFGSDNTVTLNSHVADGAWSGELSGVFSVTESDTGSIHAISLNYTAFEQEGIIQLSSDGASFQLEVVQTVPDIGATVPTPEAGFGADVALGTMNIQTYVKQ